MNKLFLFFSFLILIPTIMPLEIGDSDTSIGGVVIEIPEIIPFNNNTDAVNFSTTADFWDLLDTPADIDHNLLNNLEWGNSGHTIDIEFDFNNNNFINVQNATITDRLFLKDSEHFIKIGADEEFGGISNDTFWFDHKDINPEGTIIFLISSNKTNSDISAVTLFSQIGRNNSAGLLGNSWMVLLNNITNNLTTYSDCFLIANELNGMLKIQCDSSDTGADFLVQDDIQSFGTMFADGGIRAETLVDFVMNGRDVNIQNGSLHIFSPVDFVSGVVEDEKVTTFQEFFLGGLGAFINLQDDNGNWFATTNVFCDDGDCAESIGISGVGNIIIEANISTTNIDGTSLNFVYSLVNMLGANSFIVTADNNVGSGEVTLLIDSTNNVILSSQSIAMPSSMWDQPKVSIRFECDVTNTNRECYVDTISVNGSAIATTLTNQSGFNSEICFSDGVRGLNGACNVGIFFNASQNIVFPQGAWNFSEVSIGGIDHSALTNLEFGSSGHTFASSGQQINFGSYNFNGSGDFNTTGVGKFNNLFLPGTEITGDTNVIKIMENRIQVGRGDGAEVEFFADTSSNDGLLTYNNVNGWDTQNDDLDVGAGGLKGTLLTIGNINITGFTIDSAIGIISFGSSVLTGIATLTATSTISTSGSIRGGAGTASNPSVTTNEPDEGLFNFATNQLGISAGGKGIIHLNDRDFELYDSNNGVTDMKLNFYRSRGTIVSPTPLVNGDGTGSILWRGVTTGTTYRANVLFECFVNDSNWDDSNRGSRCIWQTVVNGSSGTFVTGIEMDSSQRIRMLPVYEDVISSNVRDLQIDDKGQLGYVPSSSKYKENIVNATNTSWVLEPQAINFNYIGQGETKLGFDSDDVAKYNPEAVYWKIGYDEVCVDKTEEVGYPDPKNESEEIIVEEVMGQECFKSNPQRTNITEGVPYEYFIPGLQDQIKILKRENILMKQSLCNLGEIQWC